MMWMAAMPPGNQTTQQSNNKATVIQNSLATANTTAFTAIIIPPARVPRTTSGLDKSRILCTVYPPAPSFMPVIPAIPAELRLWVVVYDPYTEPCLV